MKNINSQNNQIEKVLNSFKPNESMFLSYEEKGNILNSVFERSNNEIEIVNHSVKTPFMGYSNYFVQYLIPVVIFIFLGTYFVDVISNRSKIVLSDLTNTKESLNDIRRINEIKSNLNKNKEDILQIRTSLAMANSSDKVSPKTLVLADQVTNRSKEIRNQVASLINENKMIEAKNIALDLEVALKSDELYKIATSVKDEVVAATDLRLDIERQEYKTLSTSTESQLTSRIADAKKIIVDYKHIVDIHTATSTDIALMSESVLTTTDNNITASSSNSKSSIKTTEQVGLTEDKTDLDILLNTAQKAVEKSEQYLKDKDLENAIISLQSYDRIVAQLKSVLLP